MSPVLLATASALFKVVLNWERWLAVLWEVSAFVRCMIQSFSGSFKESMTSIPVFTFGLKT
ncbi:hypothetical protein, partial [Klebsiella pneumoniae]|uniref:hypothetical protein n=1 Tax=Klebsiella pneumoniae TaxID=573 RepID=UPI0025A0C782